jgi:hypothetical protein
MARGSSEDKMSPRSAAHSNVPAGAPGRVRVHGHPRHDSTGLLGSFVGPLVVLIDEFSAIAAEHVARLSGRARSAGISLVAKRELADMQAVGEGKRGQARGRPRVRTDIGRAASRHPLATNRTNG